MKETRVVVEGYENIIRFEDEGFLAYIAVHNTKLGPATGGCRVTTYPDEPSVLEDAMKLSKSMTYKCSLAGLNFGGGKMVVNAATVDDKLLEKIGACVNRFAGAYTTGTDLGTSLDDMHRLKTYTKWVEAGKFGDTSVHTALGIYCCISEMDIWMDKQKINVHVEGVGNVGMELVKLLSKDAWYNVYVSDIRPERVALARKQYKVKEMNPGVKVDLYAPCARGNVVTDTNFYQFKDTMICGGANNQLENDALAKKLLEWGCNYCPDFLVNAGGVCAVAAEMEEWSPDRLYEHVCNRAGMLRSLMGSQEYLKIDMLTAANCLARERLSY